MCADKQADKNNDKSKTKRDNLFPSTPVTVSQLLKNY